ncbi:phage tail assembly protein [Roseibium algae]|uniref:Phage tail assembly protein n=1 Tax=Roseibium algae TaxID=3123038 RepID=A0ABU8TJW3_9HYPH
MTTKAKTITVPLDEAVEVEGVTYSSLTLRRMKAGDALVGEGVESEAKTGFLMFAALAGVSVEVIQELDLEDFEKLTEAAIPMMGKSGAKALEEAKAKAKAAS